MITGRHRCFSAPSGVRLATTCVGHDQAPPVVLAHGAGQTRHSWAATARWLADAGFYAIAFDMRGHGDSDWAPDGRYDRQTLVEDLTAVCDGVGGRAALVGASSGGLTSLLAAGEGHVDATAVVLVDVVPQIEPGGVSRIVEFMTANPEGFATIEDAAVAIAGYLPDRPRPVTTAGLQKNLRQSDNGRWHWHWDPRFLAGALDERLHLISRAEAAAVALRCPTLAVRGATSDVVSPAGVESFLRLAPHAEYVDVSGAGHMVAGDDNDVFAAALVRFLERTAATADGSAR